MKHPKHALVVCGPTASGKSDLVEGLAERLGEYLVERKSSVLPTVMVDSMQVYRGIPKITNQRTVERSGGLDTRLCGFLPVTEAWSVADHQRATEREVRDLDSFVLEAGTGMYLNALLLDIDLYPKVPDEIRARAVRDESLYPSGLNPRRQSRRREIEASGLSRVKSERSIWTGSLNYRTSFFYLRPDRETLDRSIEARSREISTSGLEEARYISELIGNEEGISPSVRDSIGVRELLRVVEGETSPEEAATEIAARTRRLARRQIRWFDKLSRTLRGRAWIQTIESSTPSTRTINQMARSLG